MHFMHTVIAVACCLYMKINLLKSDTGDEDKISNEDADENVPDDREEVLQDGHTFVALIDIVFQDGTKKSCSGAIIHDNVVVTAAHCFVNEIDENVQLEVTASFVVIGTKKMFAAGYEQYLPIERVLTHPKYDGWYADICLVYTFAGMTSDKPGKIIKLAGEKATNQADWNITVLSWRKPKPTESVEAYHTAYTQKTPACDDELTSAEDTHYGKKKEGRKITTDYVGKKRYQIHDRDEDSTQAPNWYARGHVQHSHPTTSTKKDKDSQNIFFKYPILQAKAQLNQMPAPLQWKTANNAKQLSRYLTSNEESEISEALDDIHNHKQQDDDGIAVILMQQGVDGVESLKADQINLTIAPPAPIEKEEAVRRYSLRTLKPGVSTTGPTTTRRQNIRVWRRSLVSLNNQLNIERYTLVSTPNCKKILDNSFAPRFKFNSGEVTCYSSDEHILTDEDSGAPAVRKSRLVAVTVGGAECDGDHVGVGLKMNCYCSWIADNIPGGNTMNCCKNCCDVKHTEPYVATTSRRRRKNKYLI